MTTSEDAGAAFILHVRPYQEQHALVETFCREQGRVGMVFRRVRGGKSSRAAFLQPFQPLWISFSGAGELRTGRQLEARGPSVWLTGKRLFSALYLNELLVRLLHRDDPHPDLFDFYEHTLTSLREEDVEPGLRRFERVLLAELGYDVPLFEDVHGEALQARRDYVFVADQGFVPAQGRDLSPGADSARYAGQDLLAIAADDYAAPSVRRAAKLLFRQALQPHLGRKPLFSRALFSPLS